MSEKCGADEDLGAQVERLLSMEQESSGPLDQVRNRQTIADGKSRTFFNASFSSAPRRGRPIWKRRALGTRFLRRDVGRC